MEEVTPEWPSPPAPALLGVGDKSADTQVISSKTGLGV